MTVTQANAWDRLVADGGVAATHENDTAGISATLDVNCDGLTDGDFIQITLPIGTQLASDAAISDAANDVFTANVYRMSSAVRTFAYPSITTDLTLAGSGADIEQAAGGVVVTVSGLTTRDARYGGVTDYTRSLMAGTTNTACVCE